jgi:uncharacterized SAM-binding protein YcdF (DUF218 family)
MVKTVSALLLPPGSLLLVALFGLLLVRWRRRGGLLLASLGTISLWLLCTPLVGNSLLGVLEPAKSTEVGDLAKAQGIVVLGAGTYQASPEYGGDTTSRTTLERVRWAARLHRETALPLMVTGGRPEGNTVPEAAHMKDVLEREFRVPVKWVESRSTNTVQSASYARAVLSAAGIDRIALVTHASHMRRARRVFLDAGFDVLDAPTAFSTTGSFTVLSLLPSAQGLVQSRIFFHELLGIGWYHVRRTVTND